MAGFSQGRGDELRVIEVDPCIQCHSQLFAISGAWDMDGAYIHSIAAALGKNNAACH